MSTVDREKPIEGLEVVPDGIVSVQKLDEEVFETKLQVNDYKYFAYKRNNGVGKIGLVNEMEGNLNAEVDTGRTTYILQPTHGLLSLSDRLNNAYLQTFFNDTVIVSG